MTQADDRELLIRIDERVSMILSRMESGDKKFDEIQALQKTRPCEVNTDRIKKLEHATYGSIFSSIIVFCLFIAQWVWGVTWIQKP